MGKFFRVCANIAHMIGICVFTSPSSNVESTPQSVSLQVETQHNRFEIPSVFHLCN